MKGVVNGVLGEVELATLPGGGAEGARALVLSSSLLPLSINCSIQASRALSRYLRMPALHACVEAFMENQ